MNKLKEIYKNIIFLISRNNLISAIIISLTIIASFADLLI